MDGIRAIKANNIINKNLTFKFDGHPINTANIAFTILLLMIIVSGIFSSYFPFIMAFTIIVIVIAIINKLSIYSISFDNENIIIINTFNISARYDDYKKSFANKCTNEYTAEQVKNIEEVQKWLKEQ